MLYWATFTDEQIESLFFHLNDKWLLGTYSVAGPLLGGSIMNQHRHSLGLVEKLKIPASNCTGQWTCDGEI